MKTPKNLNLDVKLVRILEEEKNQTKLIEKLLADHYLKEGKIDQEDHDDIVN